MRRDRGFTLIELMVVVALIAIMSAIAVPSFVTFISNYRATAAINDFLQGITLTRIEALKRGRKVLMLPNASNGTPGVAGNWIYGWTIFVDNNGNQVYDAVADETIFQHSVLPASISTAGAAGGTAFTDGTGKTYVQFDGTGYFRLLSGAPITTGVGIVMTDNAKLPATVKTLCIGNIGRARIVTGLDSKSCTSG